VRENPLCIVNGKDISKFIVSAQYIKDNELSAYGAGFPGGFILYKQLPFIGPQYFDLQVYGLGRKNTRSPPGPFGKTVATAV
jgi:hypothetical protein